MTMLIGLKLDHYTLIAADTRVSSYLPRWPLHYEDGDHKIIVTKSALITGSGAADVIDTFKREILKEEITHTDQIKSIIHTKVYESIKNFEAQYPESKAPISFLISYRTEEDDKFVLRVCLLSDKWNFEMGLVPDAIVIMPPDSNNDEGKRIKNKILESLVLPVNASNNVDITESMYMNISLISRYFFEVSKQSKFISADLDIAAQIINGEFYYTYGAAGEMMEGNIKLKHIQDESFSQILKPDMPPT